MEKCIGCYACEVACKQEHGLPVGPRLIRVERIGPREMGGKLSLDFVPSTCRHCENPPCSKVCPVDAIKRVNGAVLIDNDVCIGCKSCVEACPFGAVQLNPEDGKMLKCDMCINRVNEGLKPACSHHCPTGAIRFIEVNEFSEIKRSKKAEKMAEDRDP
jgi:Fe-S-cluster-containing dehydrogenase component